MKRGPNSFDLLGAVAEAPEEIRDGTPWCNHGAAAAKEQAARTERFSLHEALSSIGEPSGAVEERGDQRARRTLCAVPGLDPAFDVAHDIEPALGVVAPFADAYGESHPIRGNLVTVAERFAQLRNELILADRAGPVATEEIGSGLADRHQAQVEGDHLLVAGEREESPALVLEDIVEDATKKRLVFLPRANTLRPRRIGRLRLAPTPYADFIERLRLAGPCSGDAEELDERPPERDRIEGGPRNLRAPSG